ncbi:MAG: c-type cytochrome [Gammaproteobacteria bacterium]|nr:c-type cytochrome [Gammaproteobacteria bacterium]
MSKSGLSRRITVVSTVAVLALAAAAVAAAVVYGGLYNVAATRQHTQPVYSLLEVAMRQSVRLRARDIETPPLDDPALIARGAACFVENCVQCHGGPGVAQRSIGMSMQPVPGPLVDAAQRWRPREIYWLTRHGIKMSGMPAWEFHLDDADVWAVVAFVGTLPKLTPTAFAEQARATGVAGPWQAGDQGADRPPSSGAARCARATVAADSPVDVRRGQRAMYQYACNACHTIPGITGSAPAVGPPLAGIAKRPEIAGALHNTPDNMAKWLRDPKAIDPKTAMPAMNVTEQDARDMAAFLATLN